uniref:Uncharacterized protein n=1 Tax=Anguilla anguilla TaxID=7936 RepID=A0A0E9WIP6_ANGAN
MVSQTSVGYDQYHAEPYLMQWLRTESSSYAS